MYFQGGMTLYKSRCYLWRKLVFVCSNTVHLINQSISVSNTHNFTNNIHFQVHNTIIFLAYSIWLLSFLTIGIIPVLIPSLSYMSSPCNTPAQFPTLITQPIVPKISKSIHTINLHLMVTRAKDDIFKLKFYTIVTYSIMKEPNSIKQALANSY